MVALTRWMLDVEDNDLIFGLIHRVVDEIWVLPGYHLADAFRRLAPPDSGKQNEVSQGLIDSSTNA
jgi:hypothetical protein